MVGISLPSKAPSPALSRRPSPATMESPSAASRAPGGTTSSPGRGGMIRNGINCDQVQDQRDATRHNWAKPVLGFVGGILYVVMALAVMQVAFRIWAGMW